ncbi:MAG: beta-ketoacyl-ACP synthase II [Firmicutes bacterium]|nr:beta-ketoacyl-ACP synthase II [Bacillota bacterium]
MRERRVVVTGVGVVSPIGNNRETFWEGLISGRNGIDLISRFDPSDYSSRIAGEVKDFDPLRYIEKKEAKKMDRFTQYAVDAAMQAWEDAGLNGHDDLDKERLGVSVGSGIGGIGTFEEQMKILMEKGPRRISPFMVPMLIANMAAGYISIYLQARGPLNTTVTACATSTHSIGDSFRIIQRGDADCMVAGGAEAAITPLAYGGFCSARALSTRNDSPGEASRPFDERRDGFVMGEGAGVVIMEELDSALKRGADIYGEIVGYGMSGDAYHITAPDPEGRGAFLCMKRALDDAGLEPGQIDYINAHGTSTPHNDRIETISIKKLFGEHACRLAVSSNKSMFGHLLGAAGAVELISTLMTLKHHVIPPTINYEYPDPECDLDYVPGKMREATVDRALSNSFGFGGTNSCLALKRFEF